VERGLASRHGSAFRCSIPALRRAKRWFEGRWSPAGPAGQRGPDRTVWKGRSFRWSGWFAWGPAGRSFRWSGWFAWGPAGRSFRWSGWFAWGPAGRSFRWSGWFAWGPAGRSFRWSGWSRSKGPGCRPEGVGRRGSSWCGQVRSRGVRGPCGPRCTEGRTVDACPAHGGR